MRDFAETFGVVQAAVLGLGGQRAWISSVKLQMMGVNCQSLLSAPPPLLDTLLPEGRRNKCTVDGTSLALFCTHPLDIGWELGKGSVPLNM